VFGREQAVIQLHEAHQRGEAALPAFQDQVAGVDVLEKLALLVPRSERDGFALLLEALVEIVDAPDWIEELVPVVGSMLTATTASDAVMLPAGIAMFVVMGRPHEKAPDDVSRGRWKL
jgi:uncharacterized protein (UPF0261 family)